MNKLYFGDNLDVMKRLYHSERKKEFIDLIYIDPPFNSKRNYNILFESVDLEDTKAQKEAFADTWTNIHYIDELSEIQDLDLNLYHFLENLEVIGISQSAVSYLTTLAIRIWYMHKLLKPTGSFYLHCDPTMSHYLKIVCDLIFGARNFKNEITWERTSAHNDNLSYASTSDIILFYSKSKKITFNTVYRPYSQQYIEKYYKHRDRKKGLFLDRDLTAKGLSGGGYEYEWNGITKIWRCPKTTMQNLHNKNKLYYTSKGTPRLKQFLNEMPGVPVTNLWNDISPINSQATERLGYPTQKPEALMDRILKTSSNEGDLIADFFCGCGTTIASAQKLKRKWIGSDISHLAIKLITQRLTGEYGEQIKNTFEIDGFPKDIASAKELAAGVKGGRLKFEEWIVEVLLHGVLNERRNQMGYDGYFTYAIESKKNIGLIEVKSGNASPAQLNHFIRTVENNKAQMGLFVCFAEQVTSNMQRIAKQQGKIERIKVEKIQIITVEELLDGKLPNRPISTMGTFKKAKRKILSDADQGKLKL